MSHKTPPLLSYFWSLLTPGQYCWCYSTLLHLITFWLIFLDGCQLTLEYFFYVSHRFRSQDSLACAVRHHPPHFAICSPHFLALKIMTLLISLNIYECIQIWMLLISIVFIYVWGRILFCIHKYVTMGHLCYFQAINWGDWSCSFGCKGVYVPSFTVVVQLYF